MKELNHYIFFRDGDYITGFCNVEDDGEFYGQMADYPDVIDSITYGGWYKFENGTFVEDAERKTEMMEKYNHQATWEEKMEAQITYTALVTDSLLEE